MAVGNYYISLYAIIPCNILERIICKLFSFIFRIIYILEFLKDVCEVSVPSCSMPVRKLRH